MISKRTTDHAIQALVHLANFLAAAKKTADSLVSDLEDHQYDHMVEAHAGASNPPASAPAPTSTETPAPELVAAPDPKTPAPQAGEQPTLEQVRLDLAQLMQDGKQDKVSAALAAAGATKLSQVKPEDYAKVLEVAHAA